MKSDMCQVASDRKENATREADSCPVSRAEASGRRLVTRHSSAFTLIELLVVIAIMGVLAALLLAVVGGVKKHQYIWNAQAEMEQVATAIDRYKAAYGFYPP